MIQYQYGNNIYVSAGTFLTDATEITLKLTRPHKVVNWTLTDSEIAVGTVDLVLDDGTTYEAYTYVQRTFEEGDIDQYGDYKVTLTAVIEGKLYAGPTVCFDVEPDVGACCS